VDGLPAEFWQKFDFLDDWLVRVFNEMKRRTKMTWSMRTAVVKLLFKKGEQNKMSNYRPISLLCADYKMLAKIITERMKPVLNSVIDKAQQGFIKGGNIMGSLILVKEIIEYCNEEEVEGALILMDFKKAYDRIDREFMMKTLKAMNFGPDFVGMVEMLYAEVLAQVEVNGELSKEMETEGGVRQGCPLSPFLFICVLELMAIAVRENENLGITEPETQEQDKIALFADDSCICVGKPETQTREARVTMGKYEGASGSKLHDGKTMIMKIGKTRDVRLTNKQLGVSFKILEDGAVEKYLGDLVGNEVSEEKRFEKPLIKLGKTGSRWNRERITVYGRALVSNTLMMPVIGFRANVNGMTKQMTTKILKEIKQFVWKEVPTLKWGLAVRSTNEGGIGVRDPGALIRDANHVYQTLAGKVRSTVG
jgi:hypothetical protein